MTEGLPQAAVKYPTIAVIHGGFWREHYNLDNALIDTLPEFLIKQNYAVYTIEYRRVGSRSNGGWPESNNDIITALRKLGEIAEVDIDRIGILGHSAGGTLALWSCMQLESRELGFTPKLCIPIAPVTDLEAGQYRGLSTGGMAIADYMKHLPCRLPYLKHPLPEHMADHAEKIKKNSLHRPALCQKTCQYELASPSNILPVQSNLLLCVGSDDSIIPPDSIQDFFDQCKVAGSELVLELQMVPDADHFQVVNAKDAAWLIIFDSIDRIMKY